MSLDMQNGTFLRKSTGFEFVLISSPLVRYIAMTWRPSFVSKARFVTAGAISIYFIFAILPIMWPTGGHLENQTFAI
jgi:hypothetical protein